MIQVEFNEVIGDSVFVMFNLFCVNKMKQQNRKNQRKILIRKQINNATIIQNTMSTNVGPMVGSAKSLIDAIKAKKNLKSSK